MVVRRAAAAIYPYRAHPCRRTPQALRHSCSEMHRLKRTSNVLRITQASSGRRCRDSELGKGCLREGSVPLVLVSTAHVCRHRPFITSSRGNREAFVGRDSVALA
ncbi:uncharacterized protein PHACADRAFT_260240 [Phanerochaete carnosa HHB-10118-sp]|uniref:Uncharacterized protein n=1 Tax=Phanerochaete carnosa (strain HHB-10118-sp) TaxID=650164 RepID=K5W468_PHACS|nr:uncharacterized protein PHACADRAFT_260240 [Phanerochaete carnosa HHB-10118-sp]EKM53744.1 hypothetical protein PHACADRAFT_260240 [Phanerochaete carnosa HHB-10118-sp]